jgi:hypothetical protein
VKPVVVLTVYRRYHELAEALDRLTALAHEFAEPPAVVVVWAAPEVGRLWSSSNCSGRGGSTTS